MTASGVILIPDTGERRRKKHRKIAMNVFIIYIYKEKDINNLCIVRLFLNKKEGEIIYRVIVY
jgi:hypothetical protein